MTDEKKRVLIVHNYYQIPGGEDTVVANEKKMLEENGHYVVLYSRSNAELKQMSKVKKLMMPFTTIFNIRTYREIKEIIRKQKIDIVHVHNTLNLISPAVYYAAEKCEIPIVQTIHNFRLLCPGATFYRDGHICEDCVEHGLGCAVKHKCYRNSRLQTLACVISTQIHRITGIYGKLNYICLTEFNKKKLLRLKQIKEESVFVKPNFTEEVENDKVSYKRRNNQIVFIGRLDKLKGIDFLLNTWKMLGSKIPKLIICGIGPMQEWCKKYIEDNELKNVEYKGFVSNENAKEIIAESKALVLPTQWYEGFPMVIVEAYSLNTPVIGPKLGNVGSLIVDGVTGYKYSPNNQHELQIALEKIGDMVDSVEEYYKEHYTKKSNYEILNKIYQELG